MSGSTQSGGGVFAGGGKYVFLEADVTAPVISNIVSSGITTTTATITWTTDELADTQICRGAQGGPYNTCNSVIATLVTSHSDIFTGLTADTAYYYVVKSRDGAGNLATSSEQTFTTSAAPPASGPPDYPLANYTTSNIAEGTWQSSWFTNNTTFTEPVFGTSMVSITKTFACSALSGTHMGTPGESYANTFNSDSSKLIVMALSASSSAAWVPLNFNAGTMQVSRVTGTGAWCTGGLDFNGTGRFTSGSTPTFSYLAPPNDRVYGIKSGSIAEIYQYDFAGAAFSTVKAIKDADCMGAAMTGTQSGVVVSADDDRFAVATNGPSQDNWQTVVVWSRTLGCRMLNLTTGAITNGTGSTWTAPTGTMTGAVRGKIHSTPQLTRDGKYVTITGAGCTADCTNFGKILWEIDTTTATHIKADTSTWKAGGHTAVGWTANTNGPNIIDGTETYWRSAATPSMFTQRCCTGLSGEYNEHYFAHNNSKSLASADYPILGVFFGPTASTRKYHNELVGIWVGDGTVPEKIARFAKTCATAGTAFALSPRLNGSQDGRFAMWSTNGSGCGVAGQPNAMIVVRLD